MVKFLETDLFDNTEDALKRRHELEVLINQKADCTLIFQWFCCYEWPHASQKVFFQLLEENGFGSFEAVKRKFHRWKLRSPESKRKAMLQNFKKLSGNDLLQQFIPSLYSRIHDTNFELETQLFGQRIAKQVSEVWTAAHERLVSFMSYKLTRRNTEARGMLPFAEAQGGIARSCFQVLKGAKFPKNVVPSCKKHASRILKLREQLLREDLLQDDGDFWILKENYLFTSPSIAASVLAGVNLSGKTAWKDEQGICLGKYYEKKPLKIKRGPGRPKKVS